MADTKSFCVFATDFGDCGLAWSDQGLIRVQLPEATEADIAARLRRLAEPAVGALPTFATAALNALVEYFDGVAVDFAAVKLDTSGLGEFDQNVYARLRDVPRGQTTTYGALAAAAGQPGGARAVGRAMASNRWPVIVPCHRVLAAGDRMGGFSAYGAVMTKARLLTLEGAAAVAQGRLPGL